MTASHLEATNAVEGRYLSTHSSCHTLPLESGTLFGDSSLNHCRNDSTSQISPSCAIVYTILNL